jgi:hypothetical protein
MKYLYKYPAARSFPYGDLIETNRRRSREEFEYELLDTGVFATIAISTCSSRICVSRVPEDVLIRITVHNRGPDQPAFACCHALVPEHVVMGVKMAKNRLSARQPLVQSRPLIPSLGNTGCIAIRLRSFYSPKTTQITSGSGDSPMPPPPG